MKIEVDVEQFARDIKAGKGIGGADGALTHLIKQLLQEALEALYPFIFFGCNLL